MFVLRFLIASPRKLSPHIFCHKDYRGQRTKQDDFHPQFNTYVCQPKGTQTSYDVMLELMQSAAAHQSAQQLFTVVELFDPETHTRMKLKGDEIILRPSDLAAAQAAISKPSPVKDIMTKVLAELQEHPEGIILHFNGQFTADHSFLRDPECQACINAYHGQSVPEQPGKVLSLTAEDRPEANYTVLKVSLGQISDPKSEIDSTLTRAPNVDLRPGVSPSDPSQISNPVKEVTDPRVPVPSSPLPLLARLISEITANGKAQATTLATTLGVPAADIKAAVAQEGSGLQNKGGWISLTA